MFGNIRNLTTEYWAFTLLCSGGLAIILRRRNICKTKKIALVLLISYLIVLFGVTVFCRTKTINHVELVPFWSYFSLVDDWNSELYYSIVANILIMVPVGVLITILVQRNTMLVLIVCSVSVEVAIELLQYTLSSGWVETDDIINGLFGALLGCFVVKMRRKIKNE